MHPYVVIFGEFSSFLCGFHVAGVRATDFLHKITPKWVISGSK
jgi:hypothetical protein